MDKENLIKLAELISSGKATDEEKMSFLKAIKFELSEVSRILNNSKK